MRALIKTVAIVTALLLPGLFPPESVGVEPMKFRHITSIYSDARGLGLKQPEGVACDENSVLIVADTGNGRLLQYKFKDDSVEQGATEIRLPQLSYPILARMNSKGEIFVLDGKQHRIVRITPAGKFDGYIDPQGSFSPAAFTPKSIHIDKNDNIYILDILSGRVMVLNPLGKFLKDVKFPKEYGFISDLTVDSQGSLLLIDGVNAVVFSAKNDSAAFSALTGSLKEYMRYPTSLTTDKRGRIFLLDRNGSKVVILGQDGSYLARMSGMGWKEGLLNYPSQICLNDKGEIFVADTNNNRVQVFALIE